MRAAGATAAGDASAAWAFDDPAFVLCNGRLGSTLLRFLLDAHPELACPPETNLPALCAQLATVWSLIEGAPLSPNRGDEPPDIPEAAIVGVRDTLHRMLGSYLQRRGKRRYCDKSLGTARFAELLRRVYPEAKFVCMYRHPMDVIASGMEACPWGLAGYGFDPYIAATPGNAVQALAGFWADNTRVSLAVEERLRGQCHRIRYEDLVTDPEETASGLFAFLDVAPAPGISQACFSAERERFGPADFKIWSTSRIMPDSVGRGWSIPSGMIAPQVLASINEMADTLGYLPVEGDWGTTEPPADLRVADASPRPGNQPSAGPKHSGRLGERLRAGLAPDVSSSGPAGPSNETFVAVATSGDAAAEYWLVDLGAGTVTFASREAQEHSDWDVIGPAETWEQVMDGRLNYYVALRSCQLRYCDNDDDAGPFVPEARTGTLARLLGLPAW